MKMRIRENGQVWQHVLGAYLERDELNRWDTRFFLDNEVGVREFPFQSLEHWVTYFTTYDSGGTFSAGVKRWAEMFPTDVFELADGTRIPFQMFY